MSKYFLFLAFLIFVLKHDVVKSECCQPGCMFPVGIGAVGGKCNDCTAPTPYCGYGPCNIFGCNCDGGCRKNPGCENCGRRRRNVEPVTEISNATRAAQDEKTKIDTEKHLDKIFESHDKNKDGILELVEVQDFTFKRHNIPKDDVEKTRLEFSQIDTNKDGKLTREEINK